MAPKHLWPGAGQHFPVKADGTPSLEEIVERLILVQSRRDRALPGREGAARADRCRRQAILGWGYPPFRGGPIGWLHTLGLSAGRG
jgi:3-hydroxyacyl-CoA dehydrogenase/enoyl-CoA hydratase/3-hydroxybutyryl-CoA epimerase